MKNLKDYIINIGITIIIFAIILSIFDISKIIQIILNSNYYFIFAALLLYIILLAVMSIRIREVLVSLDYKFKFIEIFKSNLAGMLASDFTPARSGYFLTAFSLSTKEKIPINDSILTILGPQLFDFTIKAFSLAMMMVIIIDKIEGLKNNIFATIVAIFSIIFVILFLCCLLFMEGFLQKFSFIKKIPLGTKFYSLFDLMQKKSHKLFNIKWKIIGITLTSWAIKGLEWFLIAKALGIVIFDGGILDYLFILIFQGTTTLIQFIPLPTLAGGGASELGFSIILVLFGVSPETGIVFGIITRFVMIIIDSFGAFELIGFIKKEGIKKIFKEISSIDH